MQDDYDPSETLEWVDAISSVIAYEGVERADQLLTKTVDVARKSGASLPFAANTAYVNSIRPGEEAAHPGDRTLEYKIRSAIRWNAAAIVLKANKESSELGGHIASFQSSETLYDTGFMHFWHAPSEGHGGDLIFYQGHCAPGIYARAFFEGRLTEDQIAAAVEKAYRDAGIYQNPSVEVAIIHGDGQRPDGAVISVGGQVNRAGVVPFRKGITVVQALQAAGDRTPFGGRNITIFRGKKMIRLDYRKPEHKNFELLPDDTLSVEQRGPVELDRG